ncbi:hypothetical protein Mapa_011807 [Marchantia paleacea]|nr:hypothetical protein Mapa_011807 [Marchantia paleacea]
MDGGESKCIKICIWILLQCTGLHFVLFWKGANIVLWFAKGIDSVNSMRQTHACYDLRFPELFMSI